MSSPKKKPTTKSKRSVSSKPKPKKKVKNDIAIIKDLKPEHAVFVNEYVRNGGNGTQAYLIAYPGVKYDSAKANAMKLLTNTYIKEAAQTEFARIFKEKDKEFAKGETYKLIDEISRANICEIIDIDGDTLRVKDIKSLPPSIQRCIKSIKITRKDTEQGEQVTHEITLKDSMKALELRAKIQNMISEPVVEVDVIIKPAVRPSEPRQRTIEVEATIEDEE